MYEPDLTIIHYTANALPDSFSSKVREALIQCIGDKYPIISISHKPMEFGTNICVGYIGRSIYNIYVQALIGAKAATTPYIACAEDDCLYIPEHFDHREQVDTFCYNVNTWKVHNANPPIYFTSGRPIFSACVAPRDLMISTLEERFRKYPKDGIARPYDFGEPGGYEWRLGLPKVEYKMFRTSIPILAFNHKFATHGRRRITQYDTSAMELPFWGNAKDVWDRIHG